MRRGERKMPGNTVLLLEQEIGQSEIVIQKPNVKRKLAYLALKRLFDVVFAVCGIILLFLPMLVIAVLIRIDSPGFPIFIQERLGKDGKPFMIFKFRSMQLDAEEDGPRWAEKNDPRCTRVGSVLRKTRLDELPQLLNILLGDMSLVGPRPERRYFYNYFESYIHGFSYRMLVKPGLTGLAQVNGGYDLEPQEKIVYDVEYINKQSVSLDVKCILKTFLLVFTHAGAR